MAAAAAARAARRLLASVLTRSRQKQDGGNNQGEYSGRILAPTCSHRAAGPGQTPPNRLQTTGNTRTRRAAVDALRHYVITSRRTGAGHVRSRVLLLLFSFITFLSGFFTPKISLKIILKFHLSFNTVCTWLKKKKVNFQNNVKRFHFPHWKPLTINGIIFTVKHKNVQEKNECSDLLYVGWIKVCFSLFYSHKSICAPVNIMLYII